MSQTTLKPTHLFYWQVEFEDGYKLSMFDEQGNEVFIRDICPDDSLVEPQNRKTSPVILDSNLMALQEKNHGLVTKFSWKPFTESLKKAIERKGEIMIELLENPQDISLEIPKDCFCHFYRSTKIEEDITFTPTDSKVLAARAFVGSLIIGYIPRDGRSRRPVINTINLREVL